MDSQSTEIIGRNLLVSQLVRDGLEVARPERDRGVDLIAYLDLDEAGGGFVAVPIQMKAATRATFGIARKYEKFDGMLLAHVWRVHDPGHASTYALTYVEALGVAGQMGWTATESWTLKVRPRPYAPVAAREHPGGKGSPRDRSPSWPGRRATTRQVPTGGMGGPCPSPCGGANSRWP